MLLGFRPHRTFRDMTWFNVATVSLIGVCIWTGVCPLRFLVAFGVGAGLREFKHPIPMQFPWSRTAPREPYDDRSDTDSSSPDYGGLMPHPSYEDLCTLNPLLRSKTPEEVEALQQELEACGYEWDPVAMKYFNEQTGRGIRTMGLDMFTPGTVMVLHQEHLEAIAEDPEGDAKKVVAMSRYQRWATKLFWVLILDALGGWLILPIWAWLGSTAVLIVVLVSWGQWIHKKYFAPELARTLRGGVR